MDVKYTSFQDKATLVLVVRNDKGYTLDNYAADANSKRSGYSENLKAVFCSLLGRGDGV